MHGRKAERPMHVLQLALNVAVCRVSRYNLLCAVANCYLVYSYSERGMGELYAYLPHEQRNTDQLLPIPPKSIKHPDYGFSVGRGAWSFASGKWTRVLELVRVNTLGEEDGEFACPAYAVSCATSCVMICIRRNPRVHRRQARYTCDRAHPAHGRGSGWTRPGPSLPDFLRRCVRRALFILATLSLPDMRVRQLTGMGVAQGSTCMVCERIRRDTACTHTARRAIGLGVSALTRTTGPAARGLQACTLKHRQCACILGCCGNLLEHRLYGFKNLIHRSRSFYVKRQHN